MPNKIPFFLIVILSCFILFTACHRGTHELRLAVDTNQKNYECKLDLGTIDSSKRINQQMLIHNTSGKENRIASIKSSCGCLVFLATDKTIKANSENLYTIQYNPFGRTGKQEEHIDLTLGNGSNIQITLTANIDQAIQTDPPKVTFINKNQEEQDKSIQFTKIKGKELVIDRLNIPPGLTLSVGKRDIINEGDTIHLTKNIYNTLDFRLTNLEIVGSNGEQVRIPVECTDQKTLFVDPESSCLRYYAFENVIYHSIKVIRDNRYADLKVTCDNPAVTFTNDNDQFTNFQGLLEDTYSIDVDCQKLKGDYHSKITVSSGGVHEDYDLYIIQEG